MDGRTAEFMRRQGGVANAAVQAEGAVKAAADIVYEPVEMPAVTVATWLKINRQELDDIPGFQEDIDEALRYGVRTEVLRLLVAAIGATTGVGAPDVSADDTVPDKLLTSVGALYAAGVQPNIIGLHPTDAVAAAKVREGAEGAYLSGNPWALMPPIVPSAALTPGEALVGDTRIGAYLGVREGLTAFVGQESDDLVRNRVTILVEGRWAPCVVVPAALSLVDLTTA